MNRLWIMPLLFAVACSPATSDTGDTDADTDVAGSGTGRLLLRFTIDPDLAVTMDEPPAGHVWGDLFHAEDITNVGPNDGAVAVASFEAEADLTPVGTTQTTTAVLVTSEPLPIGYYRAAGFLDSDANGAEVHDPEAGDPVTFPANNEFEVLEDQDVEATVEFNLLFPRG